jgi:hypothetical protein
MVSLCSSIGGDVEEYINVVSSFVRNANYSYNLLFCALSVYPKQMKITFDVFNELASMLSYE